jgi:thioredoxin reductase (NADPH)
VVKASKVLQDKIAEMPQVNVYVNHAVKEFKGRHHLDAVVVEDRTTGEMKEWKYDGVFIFIGLSPNNELAQGLCNINSYGFIVTDPSLMTSTPGLFAAGDVRAGSTKQAASAAGEGATAALMIREYLKQL